MPGKTMASCRVHRFGQCLKYWRLQAGFTQLELGQALGWTDGSAITKIEKGHYNPTLDSIYAMADILKISPAALFVESLDHVPVDLHGLSPPLQALLMELIAQMKRIYACAPPDAEQAS